MNLFQISEKGTERDPERNIEYAVFKTKHNINICGRERIRSTSVLNNKLPEILKLMVTILYVFSLYSHY